MSNSARVFLLDDEDLVVTMLTRVLKKEGYDVRARTDPAGVVDEIRAFSPDVVLLDLKLPGTSGIEVLNEINERRIATQVVMLSSDGTAESAVRAMKLGAVDYLTKPFDVDDVKSVLAATVEKGQLKSEVEYLPKVSRGDQAHCEMVGVSEAVQALREGAAKLASARVPLVLITGENGTGKELLARYIHRLRHGDGAGRDAPFIGINCAALPEQLIESELFGHEKGAFTDARAEKKGVFELAAGGTILLDEIGEMRWDLQAKLLRVLEEWKVRRVGGSKDTPIDATVFATTNRDLDQAVKDGAFRIDLFFRLSTFALHIAPLRDRPEDIMPLARHFLAIYSGKYHRAGLADFAPEAERFLLAHDWPGNVRELRNMIERIVVLECGPTILPGHLPKEIVQSRRRELPAASAQQEEFALPERGLSLEDVESTLIVQALARTGRNKAQAAKLLGITYDSLRYQVKKLGL